MSMGSQYVVNTSLTLAASATKSLILLTPSSAVGFRLTGLSLSLDASAAATGVRVDLYRVTTVGTPAGTTGTPQPMEEETKAGSNTTALVNLTTEPTGVQVLESWYVQPLGGLLVVQWPLGREYGAKASGSDLGIRVTTPASVTPDCLANCYLEE